MKFSRSKIRKAADQLAESVLNGDNYVTLNYGFRHFAAEQFGIRPFSNKAGNIASRIQASIHDRFGLDFIIRNAENFDSHAWDIEDNYFEGEMQ